MEKVKKVRRFKNTFAILLFTMSMVVTLLFNNMSVSAAGGVKSKLDQVMQSYPVGSRWTGSWGGATQCFGFARMIFSKVYGCEMPTAYKSSAKYEYSTNTNVTKVYQLTGSSVTAGNIKTMFSNGKCGDIIQGCGSSYGQHTMILYSVTSTGITIYDCNSGGNCEIKYQTKTWSQLANRYSSSASYPNNGITLYRANNYNDIDGGSSSALINLWGINNGDTISGLAQLWAKRSDSDSNHYAKFYLDGEAVTGHMSSNESGYFSFYLDTGKYANGSHTLKVEYVNTGGSATDERTITIANSLEFCGFETNNRIGGTRRIQLKTNGYSQSIKIYIDGTYLQTVEKGNDGYYTFWIDTCQYSQSMHKLTAKITVNTGDIDAAVIYPIFTQEYILAIDSPSNNLIANKGDYITVSGWLNDSAQGDFYIDGNLIKTIKGSELFYREDIGYSGGYSFRYDTSSLSTGNHVLALRASTDYRIAWDSRTFKINGEETSNPSNPSTPSNPKSPSVPNNSDQKNDTDNLPYIGTVVTYHGLKYKVTKEGKEVAFVLLDKNSNSSVIIPSTIIHEGVTYKVTAIEKNAFKNNKKIKTVTIGKNVTRIGSKAFYGCDNLKSLKINSIKLTKNEIGSKAFSKTPKSMVVTIPKKKFKTYQSMLINKGVSKKVKFKKG